MASRMEVNLSRLLLQCEKMAAAEECDNNWRYEQVSRPPPSPAVRWWTGLAVVFAAVSLTFDMLDSVPADCTGL